MSHQDWTPVTIEAARVKPGHRVVKDQVVYSDQASELRKIENSEAAKPKVLTPASRILMATARAGKKLLQKDIDRLGSFPLNSCNSWESGRICPNSQQIQILHRILGVKLERV